MSKGDNRYELEQDFMLLFENVAQGVIYLNDQGLIIDANPAAEHLLGLSLDQMKGVLSFDQRWETIKPDMSPFPGTEHPSIVALATGKPVLNVVMGVKHANTKKHVWILINAVPEFRNGESKPYRVFTTFTDISDQIDLENKLRQRNKLLHLTTSISQRFINIPLDHIDEEINAALEKLGVFVEADRIAIFDYDFKTDLAYYAHEWCAPNIESKIKELAIIPLTEFSSWIKILQSGNPINIPNVHQLAKDSPTSKLLNAGSVISLLAVPLMDGEYCIGVIGLESVNRPQYFDTLEQDLLSIFAELLVNVKNRIKNESKLKHSETKYREIAENMSDMVWTMDLNFKVNFCSTSVKKIFGLTPDAFIQTPFEHIFALETNQAFNNLLERISLEQKKQQFSSSDTWCIEGYAFKHDGSEIWVNNDIKLHFSEDNVLKGFIVITRDETIRKKVNDDLKQSKYDLGERLKEQQCVYQISSLSQDDQISSKEYFTEICKIIPPSFQDIEHTSVHIEYEGKHYYSDNFIQTNNYAKFEILINTQLRGYIEIFIPDNFFFLAEEFAMMRTVIDIIQKYKLLKKTKQAISNSEEKYRTLFSESPDGYLVIKDGLFIDCNKASEQILGADKTYIIGKSPVDISPPLQPNGKASEDLVKEYIDAALLKGNIQFEWVHTKINGLFVVVDVKLSVIQSGGEKILFTTWRDITAQREAEVMIKKLQSAVEQSPISIFITDLNGKIEYVNPFTLNTTGYQYEELIGQNPRILKSGFTNPKIYEELWDNILSGKVWKGVLNNRRKDGSLYWESTTITPIIDAVGNITHFIAIKEDITERIKFEHEIKQLNINLEKKITERTIALQNTNSELIAAKIEADTANHAKSEFLSRMSHELRTPLNSILGFSQLLEISELDFQQQKSVHHILSSGKHLLDLINEILEIARIEAGKVAVSVTDVNLNLAIGDILETLKLFAKQHDVSLIFEPAHSAIFIKADLQRIKQILLNLLNNGIKYNQSRGWVKIYTGEIMIDSRNFIKISVADNGPGIAPNHLNKLFVPFERLGAENSAVEGTGLGLSVVKQLANLMGGFCGVESQLNQGSTFWVALPKSDELISTEVKINDHRELNQLATAPSNQAIVLYIEDNLSNIELVNQIILTKRPNIQLVTDMYGKNTVELAKKHQPNLILLDLNLPDTHGAVVFELLQQDITCKNIPVIIVSADAMPNQINKLMAAGVKHYLTKPFDVTEFLNLLDQYTQPN